MILVTGASGKTGNALLRHLVARGQRVRAMVRRPEQCGAMLALGACEAVCADFSDLQSLVEAARNVESVYHICPNMHPDEVAVGASMLQAGRENGVKRFVYHSVFHPQAQAMPHHWNKLLVEEMIARSGLPAVVLQPTAYMQNIEAYWPRIVQEGIYALPYAAETRLSLVDLEDVAEAAAIVLTDAAFTGGTYELVGTPGLTQSDAVAIIAQVLRKDIRYEAIDRVKWEAQVRKGGMKEYALQTLLKMFEYYETYGMWGSSRVLQSIIHRPPLDYTEFITRLANHPSSTPSGEE